MIVAFAGALWCVGFAMMMAALFKYLTTP
jgi:hypothetical protein